VGIRTQIHIATAFGSGRTAAPISSRSQARTLSIASWRLHRTRLSSRSMPRRCRWSSRGMRSVMSGCGRCGKGAATVIVGWCEDRDARRGPGRSEDRAAALL